MQDYGDKELVNLTLDDVRNAKWYYVEYGSDNNFMFKYYDEASNNFIKKWYKNDDLHRENDLPAVEHSYFKEWWKDGVRHRENDLPAVEHNNKEHKEWWIKGRLHREKGPAKICTYKIINYHKKVWYYDGNIHRLTGPAIDSNFCNRKNEYYYIHGKKYPKDRYNKVINIIIRFLEKINYRRRLNLYKKINKVDMNEIVLKKICFYCI
jgi:hypothetical protein